MIAATRPAGQAARTGPTTTPALWRQLFWNSWRQHRTAVTGLGLMAALAAIAVMVLRLPESAGSGQTSWPWQMLSGSPLGMVAVLGVVGLLQLAVPLLAGAFIGAPLIAREFETRTSRFSRTQGVSLTRQLAATMLLLGAVITVLGAGVGLLGAWWSAPLLPTGLYSRWKAGGFDGSAVMLPAWSLLAFAMGTLAGSILRRTMPAITATFAAVIGGAVASGWLTTRLLSVGPAGVRSVPYLGLAGNFTGIRRSGSPVWAGVPMGQRHMVTFVSYIQGDPGRHGSWQAGGWFTGPHGDRLSAAAVTRLIQHVPARLFAFSPHQAALRAWLAAHHITYWAGYQPAGRYWLFQAAAAAIVVAMAVATGVAAVRLASRRA